MSADTPDPTRKPSWRERQYGKHRSRGQDFRAYLFGGRAGRAFLRSLWQAKRFRRAHIRKQRRYDRRNKLR